MTQINYRSLSEPVTDEVVRKYAGKELSWIDNKTYVFIGVALWLGMTIPFVIGDVQAGRGFEIASIAKVLLTTSIAIGVVIAAAYGMKLRARGIARMKRFAEANDAVYTNDMSAPSMNGMIFDEGHSRILEDSLAFKSGIELGNYRFTKGTGKNSRTYNYSFARVSLGRNLPHMVLDAKRNNFFGTNLPDTFSKEQRLVLEGDFNTHFDVYAPSGYEQDALYVFTPDVMQALVDHGKEYDIEVIDNELILYKTKKLNLDSKDDMESILAIVDAIASELKDQSKRYTDERVQARQEGNNHSSMPIVAEQGRRLKQGRPIVAIVFSAIIFAAIFVPAFLPPQIADTVTAAVWPAIFLMGFIFVVGIFVRGRR